MGGKLEPGESPDTCLVREVKEETGFTLHGWRFRGVVSFLSDIYEAEQMFLFTSEDFSGVLHECDEGEPGLGRKRKKCRACLYGRATECFFAFWRRMRRRFCSRCVTRASGWCRLYIMAGCCRFRNNMCHKTAPCAQAFLAARRALFFAALQQCADFLCGGKQFFLKIVS